MKDLSGAVASLILLEFGPAELLRRLADPIWFQAFGCVCGFDWHSSGLTTTLCGALKEGLALFGDDMPVAVCGGKGRSAVATPKDIERHGERWGLDVTRLVATSRLVAKIDSALVQDGFDLYHHTFLFTRDGEWAVIQQGMNGEERCARRYQWLSSKALDMVCEPHTGITCDETRDRVLDVASRQSSGTREAILEFLHEEPDRMEQTWKDVALAMPARHYISPNDVDERRLSRVLRNLHEADPQTFQDALCLRGVGPKTVAALTLVSEIVYKAPPSFNDPARFSFAHGGKDGHPFPVDKKTYDASIDFLRLALDKARVKDRDKIDALRRLSAYEKRVDPGAAPLESS